MEGITQITIKAVNSLSKGKALLHPTPSKNGGFYGVEWVEPSEAAKRPFTITAETGFEIYHNQVINLKDPYQRACWEFVKHDKIVALNSKDALDRSHEVQFYVDDEQTEIIESVKIYKKKNDLVNWINSLSDIERKEVAELLDYTTRYSTDAQVYHHLVKEINKEDNSYLKVEQAKKYMDTGHARKIQFAKTLISRNIVVKNSKYLYYNNRPIAEDVDGLLFWMESPANSADVDMMIQRVRMAESPLAIRKPDVPLSVPANQRFESYQKPKDVFQSSESALDRMIREEKEESQVPYTEKDLPKAPVIKDFVDPVAAANANQLATELATPPKRPGRPKNKLEETPASVTQPSFEVEIGDSGFSSAGLSNTDVV